MRCNSLDEQTILLRLFGNRALYLIENGRRWRFLYHSIEVLWSQYRALFAVITSTEVWNPSIGEEIVCFAEEENSHHRKAVISTSDDISKRNIASELLSGVSTVVKHCSRGVYSH